MNIQQSTTSQFVTKLSLKNRCVNRLHLFSQHLMYTTREFFLCWTETLKHHRYDLYITCVNDVLFQLELGRKTCCGNPVIFQSGDLTISIPSHDDAIEIKTSENVILPYRLKDRKELIKVNC